MDVPGTVDESSLKIFCLGNETEFADFIRINVATEVLYANLQLFDRLDAG